MNLEGISMVLIVAGAVLVAAGFFMHTLLLVGLLLSFVGVAVSMLALFLEKGDGAGDHHH